MTFLAWFFLIKAIAGTCVAVLLLQHLLHKRRLRLRRNRHMNLMEQWAKVEQLPAIKEVK